MASGWLPIRSNSKQSEAAKVEKILLFSDKVEGCKLDETRQTYGTVSIKFSMQLIPRTVVKTSGPDGTIDFESTDLDQVQELEHELRKRQAEAGLRASQIMGCAYDINSLKTTPLLDSALVQHLKVADLENLVKKFQTDAQELDRRIQGSLIVQTAADIKTLQLFRPDMIQNNSASRKVGIQVVHTGNVNQQDLDRLCQMGISTRALVGAAPVIIQKQAEIEGLGYFADRYNNRLSRFKSSIKISREDMESNFIGQLADLWATEGNWAVWSNIQTTHIAVPKPTWHLIRENQNDHASLSDLVFSVGLSFSSHVTEEMLQKGSQPITAFFRLQYKAVLSALMGQVEPPKTIHLYPLADMRRPALAKANLHALSLAISDSMQTHPNVTIFFYIPYLTASLPALKAILLEVAEAAASCLNVKLRDYSEEPAGIRYRDVNFKLKAQPTQDPMETA